jgi:hypothetical protein
MSVMRIAYKANKRIYADAACDADDAHRQKLPQSEMLVFLSVFFPTMCIFQVFLMVAWEKNRKMLVFMEYVCMSGQN